MVLNKGDFHRDSGEGQKPLCYALVVDVARRRAETRPIIVIAGKRAEVTLLSKGGPIGWRGGQRNAAGVSEDDRPRLWV